MSRYTTSMSDWWDPPQPQLPQPTAWVAEPLDTGLLDPSGKRIFKLPDPIGFVRPK